MKINNFADQEKENLKYGMGYKKGARRYSKLTKSIIHPRMRLNKDNTVNLVKQLVSVEAIWQRHKTQAHVAILFKRGKIMEIASNSIGSRSKGPGYEARTIHAERAVIKKVGDLTKLNGAVMVVIRIMKGTRDVGNSEPCHSCKCHLEKCMKEHGLRCVYYSA